MVGAQARIDAALSFVRARILGGRRSDLLFAPSEGRSRSWSGRRATQSPTQTKSLRRKPNWIAQLENLIGDEGCNPFDIRIQSTSDELEDLVEDEEEDDAGLPFESQICGGSTVR